MNKFLPVATSAALLAALPLNAAAQEEPPAGATEMLTVTTKLSRAGTFSVRLQCQPYAPYGPDGQPYGGPCRGTYNVRGYSSGPGRGRPIIATSLYEIPMGQEATLTLKLNRRGRKMVAGWKRQRLGALQEIVTETQGSGRSLNLILPKKRKRPRR